MKGAPGNVERSLEMSERIGDRITVSIDNGVADMRLSRPEKMNSLDRGMWGALSEAAEMLDADKSVRAIVMSGEGRAFCAGLDMSEFEGMLNGGGDDPMELTPRTHGDANLMQHAMLAWRRHRVPVIVAAHGVAVGGGLQLMSSADIRIVHPETKMSVLEAKWGLIPDIGATNMAPFSIREDIVRELTYTARMFTGAEAQAYGFATHVSETPLEDAMSLAEKIAGRNPHAVQRAKKLFNALPTSTPSEMLQMESNLQSEIIGQPNQIEAVMAGLEKRAGNFKD